MANFRYRVLDEQGAELQGVLEAENRREAIAQLRAKRYFPVDLEEGGGEESPGLRRQLSRLNPGRYRKVRLMDLLVFFRQLAMMLRAGHTVVQALQSLTPMLARYRLRSSVERMAQQIQAGAGFSSAIAQETVFPEVIPRLIESGEMTGELDEVMARIADDLDRAIEIRRKLVASLTYPVIVIVASIAVILFLVLGVVPKFATFLEGKGTDLPPSTQMLMDISAFISDYGLWLGSGISLALFLVLAAYTTAPGKLAIDRGLLRVPLVGGSITAAAMARSGWTLSMMINSGLTLLDAVRLTAIVNANAVLRQSFERAGESLLQGRNLAVCLRERGIPPMMVHLASVGEQSGELGSVMAELAEFYHKELDARIKQLTGMIEPLLTLLVGGLVGFVYIAFFQAVFAVANGGR
ncbi:MAG: type II secretion system F family protein [Candidatus Thiodiazotropha sp.]